MATDDGYHLEFRAVSHEPVPESAMYVFMAASDNGEDGPTAERSYADVVASAVASLEMQTESHVLGRLTYDATFLAHVLDGIVVIDGGKAVIDLPMLGRATVERGDTTPRVPVTKAAGDQGTIMGDARCGVTSLTMPLCEMIDEREMLRRLGIAADALTKNAFVGFDQSHVCNIHAEDGDEPILSIGLEEVPFPAGSALEGAPRGDCTRLHRTADGRADVHECATGAAVRIRQAVPITKLVVGGAEIELDGSLENRVTMDVFSPNQLALDDLLADDEALALDAPLRHGIIEYGYFHGGG